MHEILFPQNTCCIFCNIPISRDNRYSVCKTCFEKIEFIEEICTHCGRNGGHSSLCTFCHGDHYYFDKIYSIIKYNDFIHGKIYGYKYGHKNFLARYFAAITNDFISENSLKYDFVTGVPISGKRMRSRGFNQTYIIAEKLGDKEKYVELFIRNKHTAFLSKLSDPQRKNEIKGAFEINQGVMDKVLEKFYSGADAKENGTKLRILIFDDIFTTGTTLNELALMLKKSVADVEIIGLTLCNARKIHINDRKKSASEL
ncbi:ComF family protein [Proteocatella sphenisci]|uniref:ComF family protein n=1 Tax=Proteocatella sphenisci TaxID=181070 RepID=UPI00048CD569|nr:ComF family protein [Proteocatella sphenisci]